ncbi:MAG: ankyrin repeat domain-containing protein [Candidatus Paceibacterota bacterium]
MVKSKKGFIVLGIAFVVIIGAAITLINSKIEENTKKQEIIPETKNAESNLKTYKNEALSDALFRAVESGNFSEVKSLIEKGADVNATSDGGEVTPLIIAIRKQFLEIVSLLLKSGADANFRAKDLGSGTAIVEASITGNNDIVKEVLKVKNLTTIDEALFYAAKDGYSEIVKILINAGANVNFSEGMFGNTSLIIADDNLEIVKILINAGVDVNAKDRKGNTALMYAASNGKNAIVLELINAGADVNIKNEYGQTVLMVTSSAGNLEIVKALIGAGADINAMDVDGRTALTEAKTPEIIEALVKAGASSSE